PSRGPRGPRGRHPGATARSGRKACPVRCGAIKGRAGIRCAPKRRPARVRVRADPGRIAARGRWPLTSPVRNILTVDVEDWGQSTLDHTLEVTGRVVSNTHDIL